MTALVLLEKGEKILLEGRCSEQKHGGGALTLTNKRLVFEGVKGGIFSKQKETIFSVPLEHVHDVWVEGMFGKRLAVEIRFPAGPERPPEIKKYRFAIKDVDDWETAIKSVRANI